MRDDEWGAGVPGQKEMVGHVLGKFAPDERPLLEDCLAKAEEATLLMMQEGFQAAANKFNVKKEKKPFNKKDHKPKKQAAQPVEQEAPKAKPEAPKAASESREGAAPKQHKKHYHHYHKRRKPNKPKQNPEG